jgi:uracil-DNA glycosylase family 4
LHKAGFANQALSESADDGLKLQNCVITAVCHCAPPDNKPTKQEIEHCRAHLERTFALLPVKVMLALGGIAWKACLDYGKEQEWFEGKRPKFGHGEVFKFNNGMTMIGSYHPSQQNTFTKRLTEPMFDRVFAQVKRLL